MAIPCAVAIRCALLVGNIRGDAVSLSTLSRICIIVLPIAVVAVLAAGAWLWRKPENVRDRYIWVPLGLMGLATVANVCYQLGLATGFIK